MKIIVLLFWLINYKNFSHSEPRMDSKQCHVCGEVFINVSVVWSHISSHSRKEIYDCLVAFKSSLEIFMKQYFALKEYVDSYLIHGNCKDNEENGENNSTANMVGGNLHSDKHVFQRKDQNSDSKTSERIKNNRKERCKSNDEKKEQPDDDVVVLTETDFRHETEMNNRFISDNDRCNKFESVMGDNSLSASKGDNLNPKSGETSFSELTNLQTKSDVEHNLSVIDLSEVEHEDEDMDTKLEIPYDPLESDIQTNTYQEKESEKTTKNMYLYETSNHKGENNTDNHKNVRDVKPVLTVTGKTIQMIAREISLNSGRDRIMKETTCEECGRTFATKFVLRRHMMSHTGERTHACPTCGKGFIGKQNMMVHLRVHTGEKPYKCSYCGQQFSQYGTLYRHRKRHTSDIRTANLTAF
ncbi:zinc finger and SCAN domain-containing protein 12-like [Mytilus californianus]|uniref:zinc finger and SCAN domain-containing protein 12-like n=1 Tax=Mytilus californianus TaxID=6549 RepID=UPI00224547E5|nr:zinc finger and SCAN domain-containing protein 12-like [Mytilus californianus]